jgi:PAS domain S-box-containing protein
VGPRPTVTSADASPLRYLGLTSPGIGVLRGSAGNGMRRALCKGASDSPVRNEPARRATATNALAAALQASEARYRHLVENAPDIIYRTDAGGRFTYVNPAAEVILGRAQADLLGHNYLELIHADDRDAMRRHYGRQWVRRTPTTYAEFRVCSVRGTLWIGQNVQLIVEGDQPLGFQAVARDITDRKLAQQALARLQHQTELILNSAAEAIVSIDDQGNLAMVNPTAAQLTGYSASEMLGQSVHDLLHHSRPDGSPYPGSECSIYLGLKAGNLDPHRHQTDVFWRRDGSSFPVEYTIVPMRESDSTIGAVLTFHDISERQAIERMKDQFISVVSHELRTPVTSIRAALGILTGGVLDPGSPQARRMVELAVSNADRLIRLINDILDMERLAHGNVSLEKRPVEVEAVVRLGIDAVAARAQSARIDIEQYVEPADVIGDRDRLAQVVTNLLDNAVKFSPAGSCVTVGAVRSGDEVVFSVRDRGRGIPPDTLARIFNRFEQADASDSREGGGTGLGLAISRGIVELHGGRLWVESAPGTGSTFSFTIPAVVEPEPPVVAD